MKWLMYIETASKPFNKIQCISNQGSDVSLLQHAWFKYMGRHQVSAELDDKLILFNLI